MAKNLSTKSQRRIFLRRQSFSCQKISARLRRRRIFNLICKFFVDEYSSNIPTKFFAMCRWALRQDEGCMLYLPEINFAQKCREFFTFKLFLSAARSPGFRVWLKSIWEAGCWFVQRLRFQTGLRS